MKTIPTKQHDFTDCLESLIMKADQAQALAKELQATNLALRMDAWQLIQELRATVEQGRAIRLNRQRGGKHP